jgi:hypothetical protein
LSSGKEPVNIKLTGCVQKDVTNLGYAAKCPRLKPSDLKSKARWAKLKLVELGPFSAMASASRFRPGKIPLVCEHDKNQANPL